MRRVVLTGGVATGKSYVLEQFAALGVPTSDADQLAHTTYAPNGPAWLAVRQRFGAGIFDEKGLVDRRALGSLIFADERARSALNAIVHPHVRIAITDWFANLEPDPAVPFGIVAIPLFYEIPRTEVYDRVIVTACREEAQLARVMARGLTEHEAKQRIAAQLSTTEKVHRADYAIWTDDTHAETARRVVEIFRTLGEELADPRETGDR
ncbi:MAG: dephospho-CoA kinase [Vicinamibacterales bacterium]|jgi:dephospho-CoA kinase|nr:dephospho-CoA kinase [Vicinamibacterales bacterium]